MSKRGVKMPVRALGGVLSTPGGLRIFLMVQNRYKL